MHQKNKKKPVSQNQRSQDLKKKVIILHVQVKSTHISVCECAREHKLYHRRFSKKGANLTALSHRRGETREQECVRVRRFHRMR